MGNEVVMDQGIVLGPVGCYMYSSERIGALVVGQSRADQVWERGSTWAGNGTAVGQWAHHGHGNNVVVVVLHVACAWHAPPCAHCLPLILGGGCMGSPSPVGTSLLSSLSSLPYPLSSPPSILPSQVFVCEHEVGGGQLAVQGGGSGGGGKSG